jgi:hypothetical protein
MLKLYKIFSSSLFGVIVSNEEANMLHGEETFIVQNNCEVAKPFLVVRFLF